MSDTASQKNEAQPNIGDISAISSEMLKSKRKGKKSTSKKVGDTQNVASTAVNDVLGDITLLEEAFAEMEVSVADYEQEIPMLHSNTDASPNEEKTETTSQHSIPLLDQHASELINSSLEKNEISNDADIPELTPVTSIPTLDSQSATEPQTPNTNISHITQLQTATTEITPPDIADVEVSIGEPSSPVEQAAINEDLSSVSISNIIDAAENTATERPSNTISPSGNNEFDEVLTASLEDVTVDLASVSIETMNTEATLEANNMTTPAPKDEETNESTLSALIDSLDSTPGFARTQSSEEISIIDDQATTNSPSIEDKIAEAAGDISAKENSQVSTLEEKIEIASELVIDEAPATESSSTKLKSPHNNQGMSIPFELHSQLSKKIDDLVLDATMSLTTELQTQLSLQLESLLSNAVESVLPKLVDQMANELRAEVKGRVKKQLPIIVNEVLGKTRLT